MEPPMLAAAALRRADPVLDPGAMLLKVRTVRPEQPPHGGRGPRPVPLVRSFVHVYADEPRRRHEVANLLSLIRNLHGDVRALRALVLNSLRVLEVGDTARDVEARQAGEHLERDR